MITDEQIKAMNPEIAANWIVDGGHGIVGMGPISKTQYRVLVIACRNGGHVEAGIGAHKGHVERVPAPALLALVRRGYLSHSYGSEGGVAGRLSPSARERLAATLKGQAP